MFASTAVLVITLRAEALPQIIELDAKLNQHSEDSALCIGKGMSKNLTSEMSVKGIWTTGRYLHWYLGYSKEYCMLNDKSESAGKYQMGLKYQFAL